MWTSNLRAVCDAVSLCLFLDKRMAWWDSCGYRSLCLPCVDSEGEDMEPDEDEDVSLSSTESDHSAIRYVLGDVTHPKADREDAILVHCVGMVLIKSSYQCFVQDSQQQGYYADRRPLSTYLFFHIKC